LLNAKKFVGNVVQLFHEDFLEMRNVYYVYIYSTPSKLCFISEQNEEAQFRVSMYLSTCKTVTLHKSPTFLDAE
jgi:hypothetical protein